MAGLGRAMNRLYENRNHDIYSNGEYTVLRKIAALKPSVIIDGGANIGNYSRLVHQLCPGCLVYSFEPVKETFGMLLDNTRNLHGVIPVCKGLYREDCTREINVFGRHTHASLYDIKGLPYTVQERSEIELVRGDRFLADMKIESVDFLKMDLEGAEYDALEGFAGSLQKGLIKAVQFEYGYINISTKKLLVDFYALFESYGYIVGKIFPRTVEFRDYEFKYEDFLGPNFIAVHFRERELIRMLKEPRKFTLK